MTIKSQQNKCGTKTNAKESAKQKCELFMRILSMREKDMFEIIKNQIMKFIAVEIYHTIM